MGMIFDIKRFAVHDGPGIRTTVFLKGCPLSCFWCHNPESISQKPFTYQREVQLDGKIFYDDEVIGRDVSVESVLQEIEKELIVMEESGGGVTFSGGEPLMQPDFLYDLLVGLKNMEIHTAVDTSGYANKRVVERIIPFTDLFLYDIKMMDSHKHHYYTGVTNDVILSNFELIASKGKTIHVRVPLVNGINTDEENITATIQFLSSFADVIERVDLLPYHKIGKHKYEQFNMEYQLQGNEEVPQNELFRIKELFENNALNATLNG